MADFMRGPFLLVLAALPLAAQDYYQFRVEQDRIGGAVDFSFLNHPLGPADRIFVRDGHFYRVGKDLKPNTRDDERVRFFGANLAFAGNFPEAADAPRIARRLRRMGFNLMRLHHMDSSPDSDPKNARSILTTGPYPTFNPVSLERLRIFLDALKAEGIYVNVNLHVGYRFRPAVDNVPALPDREMPTQSKPLHMIWPRMIDLQTEYTRKLLESLKLKGDPVLAMVEINNETSLLQALMNGSLEKSALGDYKAELERQWAGFSKEAPTPETYARFIADRDRYYLGRMLAAVRETTDSLVPVTGTQMGYGGLLNLDTHADLDYQDNHFYIDHYNFPHQAWDSRDWRIRDSSSVGTGMAQFLSMAAAREMGRPYTVSEFNQPWPNRQAAELDPTLAVFGAFQDWDGLLHFAYSHSRNWENPVPSGFDLNSDWGKIPNVGQSAWIFRTAAVCAGRAPAEIAVSPELQVQGARERRGGNIAAFLSASAGYDPNLAFLHPVGVRKRSAAKVPDAKPAGPYQSDTGEVTYDPSRKLYLVNAPMAAGIFGVIPKQAAAGPLAVEMDGFAAVLVTSLDGKPLRNSSHMLLSLPGHTLATMRGTDRRQQLVKYENAADWWTLEPAPGSGNPSSPYAGSAAPVWMQRVECQVTLQSAAKALTVYPLDGAGGRLRALETGAVSRAGSGWRLHLQASGQDLAPWYEIASGRK